MKRPGSSSFTPGYDYSVEEYGSTNASQTSHIYLLVEGKWLVRTDQIIEPLLPYARGLDDRKANLK